MRAWEHHIADVEALGAELLFLAGDASDLLARKVTERGFDRLAIAPATPEQWRALGVQNPRRPELPHPTTLVLDADGTEIFRDEHVNFRTRTDPERALAALRGVVRNAQSEPAGPAPVDWDDAVQVQVLRDGTTVRLILDIAPGFHAYGAKETIGVPVYLRITNGPRATVPDGTPRAWSLGTSWVLEGRVELSVEVQDGAVSGMVGWQLCTDASCGAPRNEAFTLES